MRFLTTFLVLMACAASHIAAAQSLPVASPPDSLAIPLRATTPAGKPFLLRPGVWRVGLPMGLIAASYWGCNRNNVVHEMREEVQEETKELFPRGLHTHIDDYSRHVPAVAAYALHLAGVQSARGVIPFTICHGLAHALSTSIVSHLKKGAAVRRPDNPADFSSFPSAHTARAFMTATLLHEQFGQNSPWISLGGYAVATATGTLRVIHNRHWVTDVVAGASIGFLSAELVWRAYPQVARFVPGKLGQKLVVVPTYLPGGAVGVAVAVK
jgi:membrane-associated phospholipid phosphatase